MSFDLNKLAREFGTAIEHEARKLHARITSVEAEVIANIAESAAKEAYHEATTGEHRSEEWDDINAMTRNVAVADRLLFERKVSDYLGIALGIVKAVL